MINAPVSTIEKPLTVIDYIACLPQCITLDEVAAFGEQVPMEYRQDVRFAKAVAGRLAELHQRAAA